MRPPSHTDLEIINAGKKLQSEGKKVSGYSLSQALGGGKQSRLSEVWSSYQTKNNSPSDENSEVNSRLDNDEDYDVLTYLVSSASDNLTSTIESLMQKLAEDLKRDAQKSAKRIMEWGLRSHAEENIALQAKLDMALSEIEQWKSHREQWLKDLANREEQIDELTRELGSVRNKLYQFEKSAEEGSG